MKHVLLFILLATSLIGSAQSKEYYQLSEELIFPVLNDTGRYIKWRATVSPVQHDVYWEVYRDTTSYYIKRGFDTLPDSVVKKMGNDDTIIPKWLEQQKVWRRKQ